MTLQRKERVLIYALYDEEEIDYCCEKEVMLKKYCDDKQYKVIEIYRESKVWKYSSVIYDLLQMVRLHKSTRESEKFDKIIAYDINEMCSGNDEIVAVGTILSNAGIPFETIKQGKIGENLLYGSCITKDVKNAVKSNEKYFVESNPF